MIKECIFVAGSTIRYFQFALKIIDECRKFQITAFWNETLFTTLTFGNEAIIPEYKTLFLFYSDKILYIMLHNPQFIIELCDTY